MAAEGVELPRKHIFLLIPIAYFCLAPHHHAIASSRHLSLTRDILSMNPSQAMQGLTRLSLLNPETIRTSIKVTGQDAHLGYSCIKVSTRHLCNNAPGNVLLQNKCWRTGE